MERGGGEQARRLSRGKGKMSVPSTPGIAPSGGDEEEGRKLSLVVFACRHVFHRVCLDGEFREGRLGHREMYKCPICVDDR